MTTFVAPTFMVGNGIGNACTAGDEPPRYKIALKFLYFTIAIDTITPIRKPAYPQYQLENYNL
ncbi:MAG: hypothetical protein HW390_2393 [Candidatus Brocadiaceae bacterium]|nr:hypothetical protein [Candidatus Brocadiaceae bacterium]